MPSNAAVCLTVPPGTRDCWRMLLVALGTSAIWLLSATSAWAQEKSADPPETKVTNDKSAVSVLQVPDKDTRLKTTEVEIATTANDSTVDLLAEDMSKNWELFSSKEDTPMSEVWKIAVVDKERRLVCSGTPKGFLFTKKTYEHFELKFEWKYVTDPNGNSGVLIFTKNEPRLWPTSIQVQLHQPRAGCIFPSGEATSDNTSEAKDLAFEVGKWNRCRVVADGGRISVEINGKPAGEVSGCKPAMGSIALQSEGSETHFRNMQLRLLPKPSVPASELPAADSTAPKTTPAEGVVTPSTGGDSTVKSDT